VPLVTSWAAGLTRPQTLWELWTVESDVDRDLTRARASNGQACVRLLIAPDSFKGTFPARAVASALGAGAERNGCSVDLCPVADGGEGTMDVLLSAWGGELREAIVRDPLGRPVTASFALIDGGRKAVVEMAQASGLGVVPPDERDPERASSAGTGELSVAACEAGALDIWVAVGGSATTDGGAGAIDAIERAGGLGQASLTVLCDVTTSFEQAAHVFGPQKGADRSAVRRLTARLDVLATRLPSDPRGRPMTGCAGGLSGGLWAAFQAALLPGAATVLEALNFQERLLSATAVVIGEGRLDAQSLTGKITGEIARRGSLAGRPVHAVVGRSELSVSESLRLGLASVTEAQTLAAIAEAGASLDLEAGKRRIPDVRPRRIRWHSENA
jgi:glycerate kinase